MLPTSEHTLLTEVTLLSMSHFGGSGSSASVCWYVNGRSLEQILAAWLNAWNDTAIVYTVYSEPCYPAEHKLIWTLLFYANT